MLFCENLTVTPLHAEVGPDFTVRAFSLALNKKVISYQYKHTPYIVYFPIESAVWLVETGVARAPITAHSLLSLLN